MLLTVALLTEGDDAEMTIFRGHVHFLAHLDERLLLQTVGYEVLDGDDLQAVLAGEHLQLWHTGHGAVVVHDLHQGTGRVEACQLTQVDGGLGMTATAQHAVVLCVEGVDVSRTAKGFWR